MSDLTEAEFGNKPAISGLGSISCLNCGTMHSYNYCPSCGQSTTVKRLRWSTMIQELQERLLGMDGRFLRTFRMAFSNPGKMTREYLAGNRVKYIGPVGVFLICITAYLIFLEILGIQMSDLVKAGSEFQANPNMSKGQLSMLESMYEYFNRNFRIISFFSAFITGFLIWLLNRRMKLNLVENMVFALYIEGLAYLLSFPQLFFIDSDLMITISSLTFLFTQSFLVYVYTTFDLKGSIFRRILKGILVRVLGLIILGLIAVAFSLIWILQNKELMESFKN